MFFLYFCPYSYQSPTKKGVFSILPLFYQKPNKKGVFLYFCHYSNQSPTKKDVFLYFCPYSNESSTTNSGFLYFCPYSNQFNSNILGNHKTFNKPKLYQKWRFFSFRPYPNQNPAQKGCFFSIFALNLAKALQQRGLFLYFCTYSNQFNSNLFGNHITYNKPKLYQKWRFFSFRPYPNQNPAKKGVFFSIFALNLTKALQQRGLFLYICTYSNQSPTKKRCLLYFYPYSYQSPTIKAFSLFCPYSTKNLTKRVCFYIFAIILTKALPKRVFFSIFALIQTNSTQIYQEITKHLTTQSFTKNGAFFISPLS